MTLFWFYNTRVLELNSDPLYCLNYLAQKGFLLFNLKNF